MMVGPELEPWAVEYTLLTTRLLGKYILYVNMYINNMMCMSEFKYPQMAGSNQWSRKIVQWFIRI